MIGKGGRHNFQPLETLNMKATGRLTISSQVPCLLHGHEGMAAYGSNPMKRPAYMLGFGHSYRRGGAVEEHYL